jgi:DNA-binding MarR family transcriptional regulator
MPPEAAKLVERFHHLAIVMLRAMRAVDEANGLAGPRASALSLLVFRGPLALGELARLEGVKAPTMSRLVKAMQAEGLVAVASPPGDARRIAVSATPRGRKLLLAGRDRRLAALRQALKGASRDELAALATVVGLLERSFRK